MSTYSPAIGFHYSDGGRRDAGFKGDAGDCVARAISIATTLPYEQVYAELADRMAKTGRPRSARNGIPKPLIKTYLDDLGWQWHATMRVGSGCQVHLRRDELPGGHLIVQLSKHVTAVKHGIVWDTFDPSRGGTRCVYGYWTER